MDRKTVFSLILLGALVIGSLGIWYRVASDDAVQKRQEAMYQEYSEVRVTMKGVVERLDSQEGLVDAAREMRDGERTLKRLETPAEGELEKRIKLQRAQIANVLKLVRMNAEFDALEERERALKTKIRQQEVQLAKPL